MAEQLRQSLSQTGIIYEGHEVNVTASFGVKIVNLDNPHKNLNSAFDNAMKLVDKNLYVAKKCGRNKVVSNEKPFAKA